MALAVEHRPDIALVDIQMPVLDGLEATRQIFADERLDKVRVVILTNFGLDEYIFRALRAGASGFLLKDTGRPGCSRRSGWSCAARRCCRPRSPAA